MAPLAFRKSHGRDRALSAAAAAATVGLLIYALIVGLIGTEPREAADPLQIFTLDPPPPTPEKKPVPPPERNSRPEGEAAPPNLKSKPKPVVAPPQVLPLPVTMLAAPIAGEGREASAGAAEVPGPGTGAGGEGSGLGGGGSGDGDGGGGGWDETPPVRIGGDLRDSDYPRGARDAGIEGEVEVRYLVGVNGRVTHCEIAQSSGNAEIDETTCRLIQKRFRFRPSRDANGRPVPAYLIENHSWAMQ